MQPTDNPAPGQGPAGGDPPAGTPPPSTPPQSSNPPASSDPAPKPVTWPDGSPFDPERAQRAIQTQRKEIDDLKAQLKVHDDAQLSDLEKRDKRIKELEEHERALREDLQRQRLESVVLTVARSLDFVDEHDAIRYLDSSQLTLDDDGKPTNAKAVLEKLLESKPYLKKQTGPGAGPPPTPGRQGPMTREQAIARQKEDMANSRGLNRY